MSSAGIQTIIGNLPKQETFVLLIQYLIADLSDFDKNIAFINLNTLESFFNFEKNNRNLEIYLKNPSNIETIKLKDARNF